MTWAVALLGLLGALALLPSAGVTAPYEPHSSAQAVQYTRALDLGIQAYVYGYPLLDSNRVFRTSTSVNVPDGAGGGPVNEFSNIRRLAKPSDKTVVAPNHDTLYSMAWLDLRAQPIVVHMPVVRRRFAVFELVDPYTENFANIGAVGRPPGNYAVTAPGWHGRLPKGVRRIRSAYTRVWIIGRTYIRNAADTPKRQPNPERVRAHPAGPVGDAPIARRGPGTSTAGRGSTACREPPVARIRWPSSTPSVTSSSSLRRRPATGACSASSPPWGSGPAGIRARTERSMRRRGPVCVLPSRRAPSR